MEITERVAREKQSYDSGNVLVEGAALQARFNHVFKCPNSQRAEMYLDASVREFVKDRDLLDYGCSDGWMVPRYAGFEPRSITGIDISETGIELAIRNHGHLAKFYVADAHNLPFPEESFDVIAGRSILHHLDFDIALREIARTLRPGGRAIFMEPLVGNPVGKAIRRLTPRARTKDELPLSKEQIQFGDKLFGGEAHYFFNLFSVPVGMATSLTSLHPDNILLRWTDTIDQASAKSSVKYWMRQVVLVWKKM